MLETIAISISVVLSVLALAGAALALRTSDPILLRRLSTELSGMSTDIWNKLTDLEQVQVPRMESRAEALLERAELRFDAAESKRKSVAARDRHSANRGGNGAEGFSTVDPEASRADQKAAIERSLLRG